MPVEVLPRATSGGGESRLSSFGFSGTIAHGAFGATGRRAVLSGSTRDWQSLFRRRRLLALDATQLRLSRLAATPEAGRLGCCPDTATRASTGTLVPSAGALFSSHVVNDTIILPGVGYMEMAFCAEQGASSTVLLAVAFLTPCKLP